MEPDNINNPYFFYSMTLQIESQKTTDEKLAEIDKIRISTQKQLNKNKDLNEDKINKLKKFISELENMINSNIYNKESLDKYIESTPVNDTKINKPATSGTNVPNVFTFLTTRKKFNKVVPGPDFNGGKKTKKNKKSKKNKKTIKRKTRRSK